MSLGWRQRLWGTDNWSLEDWGLWGAIFIRHGWARVRALGMSLGWKWRRWGTDSWGLDDWSLWGAIFVRLPATALALAFDLLRSCTGA
jgi:hypothetical protein